MLVGCVIKILNSGYALIPEAVWTGYAPIFPLVFSSAATHS